MPINSPSLSLPAATNGGASMARAASSAPAAAGDESPDNKGFQTVLEGQTMRSGGEVQQPQPTASTGSASPFLASIPLPAEGSDLPGTGMELPLPSGEVVSSAPVTAQLAAPTEEGGDVPAAEPAIVDLLAWLAGGKRTSATATETAKQPASDAEASAEAPAEPALLVTGGDVPAAQPQVPVAPARSDQAPADAGLLPTGTGNGSSPAARVTAALPDATPDAMPVPAGDPGQAAVQPTKESGAFGQLVQALDREPGGEVVESGGEPGPQTLREPSGRTTAAVQGTAATATSAAASSAQIQVPVGRQGWSEAVLEKVMWFSSQLIDSAEIQLSPPELGPVQVRISTQHEQASVYFASHNAAVRDALDQTLPRLRELFESQGLQLADAAVGERGFADERASQQERGSGQGRAIGASSDGEGDAPLAAVNVRRGLVDAYA